MSLSPGQQVSVQYHPIRGFSFKLYKNKFTWAFYNLWGSFVCFCFVLQTMIEFMRMERAGYFYKFW